MAFKNILQPIVRTSIASSTLTGSYQVINASGLPHPCVILVIVNNSSQDVDISFNGSDDHDRIPLGMTRTLNAQTNSLPNANFCCVPAGQKIYAKGTAGTGSIYIVGYYEPPLN